MTFRRGFSNLLLIVLGVVLVVGPSFDRIVRADSSKNPRLVLLLVVDQLRGDLLRRFEHRFGEGGFRLLLERGRYYANAHYGHSTTYTAVGHATLATGGYAAQHGMAGNSWLDSSTGEVVYCVGDAEHTVVGKGMPGSSRGISPRNLTSSTFGDELVMASGHRSRVFSVSLKDRGAVLCAGRMGKSFWYDSKEGRFVSSTYYFEKLPEWAREWNEADPAGEFRDRSWELLRERASYVFAEQDNRPYEFERDHFGRTFPHNLGHDDDAAYYSTLRMTPFADELTVDFIETLLENEKLGSGKVTDVLTVSLSATDYIGHTFGPGSLEYEDNLLRLDRTVARLLKAIDARVGLNQSLIVLSADHGIDAIPEYRQSLGYDAPRVDPDEYLPLAEKALADRFGNKEPLIAGMRNVSVYLDLQAIERQELDRGAVAAAVARNLSAFPGIAGASTREDLVGGRAIGFPQVERVQRSVHPTRTGDVVLVQDPFAFLYYNVKSNATIHGSPYPYDTHVPVLFCGQRIRPGIEYRPVDPVDVAPTIAAILGINAPSGAVGQPLFEVLERR